MHVCVCVRFKLVPLTGYGAKLRAKLAYVVKVDEERLREQAGVCVSVSVCSCLFVFVPVCVCVCVYRFTCHTACGRN